MDIKVIYDNAEITPTPLVNREYSFINYGSQYGNVEQITLNGFLTGISTDTKSSIYRLTALFSGNFKTLEVFDDVTSVYKWPYTVIEDISFPQSYFHPNTFSPYTVKLNAYNVPSGVLEPSNEYSFTQNTDGTVDVVHKISAKGVKDANGAFNNAVNFVKTFVNKNPYTNCVPTFIPNGSGIRSSISETIDRLSCAYSVVENFKYTTGTNIPYIETTTININDSKTNDYTIVSLDAKWQGSTVDSNAGALQASVTGINLITILSNYGINVTNAFLNSFSLNQNSGANSIDIKAEYYSGLSNDYSGYFDYAVSMDKDMVLDKTIWKIDGEFICKGPLSFRRDRITSFKTANSAAAYIPYLVGLIQTSAIYTGYSTYSLRTPPNALTIADNTGLATLKLSATFDDEYSYSAFISPKYTINSEPSIWVYESIPSANIEGHYIIQDPQVKKANKLKLTFDTETSGVTSSHISTARAVIGALSGTYINNAFLINDSVSTGITSISIENDLLGTENINSDINNIKVYGSLTTNFQRIKGFKFGY